MASAVAVVVVAVVMVAVAVVVGLLLAEFADELRHPVLACVGGVFPPVGVDGYFEECGLAFAEEFDAVGRGGHEDAFAGVYGGDGAHRLDGRDAVDTEVDDETVVLLEVFPYGSVEGYDAGVEVGAGGYGGALVGMGVVVGVGMTLDAAEVDGLHGLGCVELALLSVAVEAVVVVDAIGACRIHETNLLGFFSAFCLRGTMTSPGSGCSEWRRSVRWPLPRAAVYSSGVVSRRKPLMRVAPGSASMTYHISVLPCGMPRRWASSSSGWTWMERSRAASMSFTSSGNSVP